MTFLSYVGRFGAGLLIGCTVRDPDLSRTYSRVLLGVWRYVLFGLVATVRGRFCVLGFRVLGSGRGVAVITNSVRSS